MIGECSESLSVSLRRVGGTNRRQKHVLSRSLVLKSPVSGLKCGSKIYLTSGYSRACVAEFFVQTAALS